jgi:CheY-like chemotaxis protein
MANIIIVDDEASVRSTVKLVLEGEKHKVTQSNDADACWERIKKGELPDLILLDVMMPGMPPTELIKLIKGDPRLKRIKIVYITAVAGIKESTRGVSGIEGTVEKPFKNEDLIEMVKKVVG